MTKLEQIARALAVYQFGSDESWEDQIPMARVVVEALREPSDGVAEIMNAWARNGMIDWRDLHRAMVDAILSEKLE